MASEGIMGENPKKKKLQRRTEEPEEEIDNHTIKLQREGGVDIKFLDVTEETYNYQANERNLRAPQTRGRPKKGNKIKAVSSGNSLLLKQFSRSWM